MERPGLCSALALCALVVPFTPFLWLLLWALYLPLVVGGQVFLSSQWDVLRLGGCLPSFLRHLVCG